jgi:hypothetical protein
MNIWTIMETDEDGIPSIITKAFRKKEDAIAFVMQRSQAMEYPEGNEVPLVVLEDNSEGTTFFITPADLETPWFSWSVIETELN